MKGIILAGGTGSRLYPITKAISKQLMPVYDKPMIYYPLTTLISAGIKEILIITTPHDQQSFKNLLGDGSQLGCKFEYIVQSEPDGLASAFILGEDFIGDDSVTLILGDNIFYGNGLSQTIKAASTHEGMTIFGSRVNNPKSYGVVEFDDDNKVLSVEEKPENPKSSYAIPGIYICDNRVIKFAKDVQPSERGEKEITEVQQVYLDNQELSVVLFKRGTVWLDTGTFASMSAASQFVQVIEERQDIKIGCIEEAAYLSGFITLDELHGLAKDLEKSGYGQYLLNI